MGIEKLNTKCVDIYKRNFVEVIISVSYFRIKEFREKFLQIILKKSNFKIEEWKNTNGMLLDDSDEEYNNVNDHNPSLLHKFDW